MIEAQLVNPDRTKLKEGWGEVTLENLLDENFYTIKNSLREPLSSKTRKQMQGEYPYYGAAKKIDSINKYKITGFHLLVAEDGTVTSDGKRPMLQLVNGKFWVSNHAHVLQGSTHQDTLLLYYILSNVDITGFITGAVQPKLSKMNLMKIKFAFPPLPEQEAIVEVLSSLDDKIDLLHRQNKTLENLAQTLFHQWFIANPNLDWESKPLDEIAHYLNGLACQKYPPIDDDKLPVLKIKELKEGFKETYDWATSQVDKKYIVQLGDVVFSWSASLVIKIWHGEKCVLNQHLFKVTSENYPSWFCYLWTKYYIQEFRKIANSKSTTMGHINRSHLSDCLASIPNDSELKLMDESLSPIFEKITQNYKKINTLRNLRDDLLPKLIRGKIKMNT